MPFKAFIDLKKNQSTSKKEIKDKKGETPPKEEIKSKISKNAIDRGTFQQSHSR
nr:hypothetical protein [Candidatus Sigynarchaeota archaeon]